jgi:hypothetical protein
MATNDYIDHLLDNDATITADANGATKIRPNFCRGVVVDVIIDDAPTGTSPTLKFTLQSSLDGTNWLDVANTGNLTAAGNSRLVERVPAEPYWRVNKDIGGSASPTFTGVHTHLIFLK